MFNKGSFLFGILLLFSLIIVSALTFEQNSAITLNFPCTYNGSFAPASTLCNLSIIYPNNSLMVENELASYSGSGIASFIVPDSSVNGNYKVPISCTYPNGISEEGSSNFIITPNGESPDIAKTFVYLGLIFIILILFIICLYFLFKLDSLSWKIGLLAMSYIILNGFLLMCWKSAEMFLTSIPFIEIVFRVLYITSNVGYFPVFIGLVTYLLIKLTDEKNMNTLVGRGYDQDLAKRLSRGRR